MKKNNLLNLADPEKYRCEVVNYFRGRGTFVIRVFQGDYLPSEEKYVHFSDTLYFSGPFYWLTGNLCLGTDEECLERLYRISDSYCRFAPEELNEKWSVYKFQDKRFSVEILANSSFLTAPEADWFINPKLKNKS